MVQVAKSVLAYVTREYGNHILDSEVEGYGRGNAEEFLEGFEDCLSKMLENPEEPAEFNDVYDNPNFNVLYTIIGYINGIEGVGHGRNMYNFIDVGLPDKLMVVIYSFDVERNSYSDELDYDLVDRCILLLPKGTYTDYLMTLVSEDDII